MIPSLDDIFGPGASAYIAQMGSATTPSIGLPPARMGVFYSGRMTQGIGGSPRTGHSKGAAETTPGMGGDVKPPGPPGDKYPTLAAANANRQARMPDIEQA